MSTLEAIILGIIQGITEFLPVSSSGHLQLFQEFLGVKNLENYILFSLVCHLGTLLAILIIFAPKIKAILIESGAKMRQVILGTLPLFPLVLIMKPIKALFDQPQYLGYFFLLTSLLLYLGNRFGKSLASEKLEQKKWRDSLVIGTFQAVAVLPGVSRSGSTISAAKLLGWSQQEAITFSFLLAIPAILGGTALECWQLTKGTDISGMGFMQYFAGFISSFAVGYCSLLVLIRFMTGNKFMYFAWYCLFLGLATSLYFNYR